MTTIVSGQQARFTVLIRKDGVAVPIAPNAEVRYQLFTENGSEALFNVVSAQSDSPGANWPQGIVEITISDGETQDLPSAVMLVVRGPSFIKRFRLEVIRIDAPERSALFVKDFAVEEMRNERLMMMAQRLSKKVKLSDKFIWDKVLAAEAEIGHNLRVPLTPTRFFPHPPTQAQIDELNGMPWGVDPAYDYDPGFFQGEKWGFLVMRQKPLVSVGRVRFVYPAPTIGFYEIPGDWLRMDRKYGHIRFVPASSPFVAPLNAFILQALGGGRTIPFAIEVDYVAGIENAAQTYPDLIDAVKKLAVLKIIEDKFLPQSGSISGDGLSQSVSIDMSKYRETIDDILNGRKGSNGGLMTAIHGVRVSVMGA